jgi:hypothetical protein
MTFDELLDEAGKAAMRQKAREDMCRRNGGHYRDFPCVLNGHDGFKCRCGFHAVESCREWDVPAHGGEA